MRPTDRKYMKSHEWCKVEQGRQRPREVTLAHIAEALGLTPKELDQRVYETILAQARS